MPRSAVNGPLKAVLALLLLAAGSCAGDDATPRALYSEPCGATTECAEGLECIAAYGICTQRCMTMQECRTRLEEPASICVGGVCLEPCNATDFNACPNGLNCVQSSAGAACSAN